MNNQTWFKILFIMLCCFLQFTFSQTDTTAKFITVIPGPEYEAGWFHNVFFGTHWRELWTTPLKVRVLELDKFAAGLTPIKKGGVFKQNR